MAQRDEEIEAMMLARPPMKESSRSSTFHSPTEWAVSKLEKMDAADDKQIQSHLRTVQLHEAIMRTLLEQEKWFVTKYYDEGYALAALPNLPDSPYQEASRSTMSNVMLQTVPPSCVNRDDTGSPKTAVYGGATRARVSSQAWKHAIRKMFAEEMAEMVETGKRTLKATDLVAGELAALAPELDNARLKKDAKKALENAGIKLKDDNNAALLFLSTAQARALARLAAEDCEEKDDYKKALKENPSVDMALFGRMVASDPSLNYDAAAQVAHSISTHAVQNEFDYFTAVDDCAPEDSAGAGHLGTVEYNSSTLYRYATVNMVELVHLLGAEKAAQAVRVFGEAFIRSMPTGKQNSFANRTLPDAVYVTLREDQPVNLCGAFEKPVRKSPEGYAEPSKTALKQYAQQVYACYADAPAQSFAVGIGLDELAPAMPLNQMLTALERAVKEKLPGNEV